MCVLVHFAGAERLRARAYYIMCVGIGAVAYLAGTAAFDVVPTWQMMLIALGGPLFTWMVYEALRRRGIDERR